MSELFGKFVSGFCSHLGDVSVSGASDGPLKGLSFAVKDIIDVEGVVTGVGNPDWFASHGPAPRHATVVQQLLDAGADIVGGEELAAQVQKGEIDFDRCISTPDMMSVVGKLGKVLGPRGLMPNPKLGTVTKDVAEAVKAAKGGQVEFRVEKAGVIHAGVGKASFSEEALSQNIAAFVGAIQKARPSGAKGIYMKKVALSSTMGPGIKLDLATLSAG